MNNDMMCFMGKTIEEITKEELWEALGLAHKKIERLEKKEFDNEMVKFFEKTEKVSFLKRLFG